MADTTYPKGEDKFVNWLLDDIRVVLVSADVPFDPADEFLADIAAGVIATSPALTGKTSLLGVFDAADVTLPAVSGDTVARLVFVRWTGNPATTDLLASIDSYNGLPFTPDGSDVPIVFSNAAFKIFKSGTV